MILCCYAQLNPLTERSVKAYAPQARLVNTSATTLAYWQTIEAAWTGDSDLIVIEQDIEITAETIPAFEQCPEPWCCFSYYAPMISEVRVEADDSGDTEWAARIVAGAFRRNTRPILLATSLGCTKFSASLQQKTPLRTSSPPTWDVVDETIRRYLEKAGYSPHVHGQVQHHHDTWTVCVHRGDTPGSYRWHYAGYPATGNCEL